MIHARDCNKQHHDALSIDTINVCCFHLLHIALYPVLLQDTCVILYFRMPLSIKTNVMQYY